MTRTGLTRTRMIRAGMTRTRMVRAGMTRTGLAVTGLIGTGLAVTGLIGAGLIGAGPGRIRLAWGGLIGGGGRSGRCRRVLRTGTRRGRPAGFGSFVVHASILLAATPHPLPEPTLRPP
ncbi:hypothetical protein [Actinoplanes utahensis]|uniref:hypothetical protein n=1 Tax=Actinoplanes utahensis TaxID=1869 RepID=UPI000AA840E5|nr:hypothetical protein [Actinoplanes utahensis]GIF27959.1 hypothetical protein Aut01nite_09450 [Actinoplanes utahensis]